MTLKQIAKWQSTTNPLKRVLGKQSICHTITTRVAESEGGGVSASALLYSPDLEETSNIRWLYED